MTKLIVTFPCFANVPKDEKEEVQLSRFVVYFMIIDISNKYFRITSKDYLKVNHVQQYGTHLCLRNAVKLNIIKEIQIFQFPSFLFSCFPVLIFYELFLSAHFRLFLPLSCLL